MYSDYNTNNYPFVEGFDVDYQAVIIVYNNNNYFCNLSFLSFRYFYHCTSIIQYIILLLIFLSFSIISYYKVHHPTSYISFIFCLPLLPLQVLHDQIRLLVRVVLPKQPPVISFEVRLSRNTRR